jgi:DNA processing protein
MTERRTLFPNHPLWPRGLDDLEEPPRQLRVEGDVTGSDPVVSIVGMRAADPEASLFARRLAADLARAGCLIVSGGARGIDAAAHLGALDADRPTWVFLPGGLDALYPRAHERLFARIRERGALLSELDDPVAPLEFRFLQRNRLIAAVADAVIVVQAARRSGALSTAAHASALGRPLFVCPCSPWDPRGGGVLSLLERGARVCSRAGDVLALFEKVERTEPDVAPSVERDPVVRCLGSTARHPDEIARASGLSLGEVYQRLVELEMAGRIEARPGGKYGRRSAPPLGR